MIDYDGTSEARIIYKLQNDNELIGEQYNSLLVRLAEATIEGEIEDKKLSAYVIEGISNDKEFYFFSMQNPLKNMKKKKLFRFNTSKYEEITKPILALRCSIDAIIYDGKVYMLSMAAENLFQMERSYKKKSEVCIKEIQQSGMISNIELLLR